MKVRESKDSESTIDLNLYSGFLSEIKSRIKNAQYQALQLVNKELVSLYWEIGKLIVEKQKEASWGKSIVEKLASDLQIEFSGVQGYSSKNLWRMRQFYEEYANDLKLSPLVREISWSHNLVILASCKNSLEREFYIRMTKKQGWSKNVLIHQIEGKSYEKTLAAQTSFKETLPSELQDRASLTIKDEYTFGFLNLRVEHEERELESAILRKIEPFLKEMGGVFAFIGSQYRLEVGDSEYFIDLLLYHRKLKCLVAIELKVGKFVPEYVGKMQFYLTVLDRSVKQEDENPSIGIIICKSKDRTIVEYTLQQSKKPIGVSTYKVLDKVPQDLEGLLPAPEQIARLLNSFEDA